MCYPLDQGGVPNYPENDFWILGGLPVTFFNPHHVHATHHLAGCSLEEVINEFWKFNPKEPQVRYDYLALLFFLS